MGQMGTILRKKGNQQKNKREDDGDLQRLLPYELCDP
jgi:hypothetical protein